MEPHMVLSSSYFKSLTVLQLHEKNLGHCLPQNGEKKPWNKP